ncbi:MAG: glyoxalase, partial [Modestobacter sp.]|nr:glyoxalase [Modestobacter sp.]
MDMKLELVPMPVTDVDRAKAFYVDKLGFTEDVDVRPTDGMRVVQLTPPGSACSIVIGTGMPQISDMAPGSV